MKLFYIEAGDDENNLALFTLAQDRAQAIDQWTAYYEIDAKNEPHRVFLLPITGGLLTLGPGPLPWHENNERGVIEVAS